MKAIRIHAFGGSDQVKVEQLPVPEPERGQALVQLRAAGVNPVDWMIREHQYNPQGADRVPLTLGQDLAGVIVKLGPGTTGSFHVGDEVLGETWGSFAEYAVVPVQDLVHKPAGLDFVTAASLPMIGLTAWQVAVDTALAGPGKRFLVHGAGGGVGSLVAQFAMLKGAEVVATASAPSMAFLRLVGVKTVVDYTKERFEDRVKDVDVVVDPLGGDTQARSWKVLKRGGMLINLVGEIDRAAAKQAGVDGIEFGMTYDRGELQQVVDLVAQGAIKVHVAKVLPLDRAREALELNQQNRSHGKIVLEVGAGQAG